MAPAILALRSNVCGGKYRCATQCETEGQAVSQATLTGGNLKATLLDNANSPRILSGIDSLFNVADAPKFDAYDPDSTGASAGLNFEHIISGHRDEHNAFAPRNGQYALYRFEDGKTAELVRRREDDPWGMSSTLRYSLAKPAAIDVDFQCTAHDTARFGARAYAVLFFANYMNDVEDIALNFRGIDRPGSIENWIRADAPPGHADWNQGGTYRHVLASDLAYDTNHNFKLNSWSYDYPRFTQPFYYGRAAQGMVFMLMFDKAHTSDDEIRFSLFKFKTPKFPRPAWDFQYVIRDIQQDRSYGFKARLVWKRFVSPEDCLAEYKAWADNR